MKNGFNLPAIPNVAPACLPSGSTPANVNVKIPNIHNIMCLVTTIIVFYSKVLISGWGSLSSGGSHPNVLQKVQDFFSFCIKIVTISCFCRPLLQLMQLVFVKQPTEDDGQPQATVQASMVRKTPVR